MIAWNKVVAFLIRPIMTKHSKNIPAGRPALKIAKMTGFFKNSKKPTPRLAMKAKIRRNTESYWNTFALAIMNLRVFLYIFFDKIIKLILPSKEGVKCLQKLFL